MSDLSTHNCKYPGCENEARADRGRYSYCDVHQGMGAKLKEAKEGKAAELKALLSLAKRVDRAHGKAATATRHALALKAEADAIALEYQQKLLEIMRDEQS